MDASLYINFTLTFFLAFLAWEDFRYRAVSVWALVVLTLLCGVLAWLSFGWRTALEFGLLNNIFLLLQYALLTLYFSIKEKAWVNLADRYLGRGDIWFVLPMAWLFTPLLFVWVYTVSLVLVLLGALAFRSQVKQRGIPLVGGLAICWGLILWSMHLGFGPIN